MSDPSQETPVRDPEPETDPEELDEFPPLEVVSARVVSDRAALETPVYPGIPFN